MRARAGGGVARCRGDKRSPQEGMGERRTDAPLGPHFPHPRGPPATTAHGHDLVQCPNAVHPLAVGDDCHDLVVVASWRRTSWTCHQHPQRGSSSYTTPAISPSQMAVTPAVCSTTTRCPTTDAHSLSAVVVSSPTEAACGSLLLSPTPCHSVRRAQDSLTSPATTSSSPFQLDVDNSLLANVFPGNGCCGRDRSSENIPFSPQVKSH